MLKRTLLLFTVICTGLVLFTTNAISSDISNEKVIKSAEISYESVIKIKRSFFHRWFFFILELFKKDFNGLFSFGNSTIKYNSITHYDALSKKLNVLDSTALSLCMDNNLPIIVFNIFHEGNIHRICRGEKIGTVISSD